MLVSTDIGTLIEITEVDNPLVTITGTLRNLLSSPEVVETVPGVIQGNYKDVWTPGFRNIIVSVELDSNNKNSPILNDILGATFYTIKDELYTIESVDISSGSASRTGIISLIRKQGTGVRLSLPTELTIKFAGVGVGPRVFKEDFPEDTAGFALNTTFELALVTPATFTNPALFHVTFSVIPFHGIDSYIAPNMSELLSVFIFKKTVMARDNTLVQEIWTANLPIHSDGYVADFKRIVDNKATTKYNQYTFAVWEVKRTSIAL